ncbi:hypothetical protein [Modicisalibacter luteus]|uniref:hypothetical protein n=1 Tax=Modicisalibacter luteus TaxID=453962 RepID=UPI00362C833A
MLNSQPLNTAVLNGGADSGPDLGSDWERYAPIERQTIYVLDVGETRIPISSVQATMRTTGQSYLQAVIPSGNAWAATLEGLRGQVMQLRKGYRYKDGSLSPWK